jgi:hypothetical protein
VATGIIARYAVDAGYLDANDLNDADYGWSKLTNAAAEDDPSNFADLLSDIMANPQVRDGMTKIIRQYDPNFSGQFNDESLAGLANNARNGAMIRANRARKAGDKTGETNATKAVDKYAKSSMVIRATLGTNADTGFVEQNEAYRAEMDAILSPNSGASPAQRQAAITRYGNWLAGDGSEMLGKVFPAGSFDPPRRDRVQRTLLARHPPPGPVEPRDLPHGPLPREPGGGTLRRRLHLAQGARSADTGGRP